MSHFVLKYRCHKGRAQGTLLVLFNDEAEVPGSEPGVQWALNTYIGLK